MRFDLKHLDRELNCLLEGTVPPVDLNAVSAFRSCLERLAKKAGLGCRISLVHYYSSKIRQELFNVRVQLQTTSTSIEHTIQRFCCQVQDDQTAASEKSEPDSQSGVFWTWMFHMWTVRLVSYY